MRNGRALSWMSIGLCLSLASCSIRHDVLVRNATGVDLLVRPLSQVASVLKAGESSSEVWIAPLHRQEALIKRGDCLYTYPAPERSQLPKSVRKADATTVVIHEDMRLSLHVRSKDGVDGPEILVAGFPLKPTTYCGRRGEG